MSRRDIGIFVLGAVLSVGFFVGKDLYTKVNLHNFFAKHHCVSLGFPPDAEDAKVLGEGFACGDLVVATPK